MESTLNFLKEKVQDAGESIGEVQNVGNHERLISLVAGAVVAYYGLQHKESLLGKALTFAGGLLITRATTGFCPVNKAVGRNSLLTEAI